VVTASRDKTARVWDAATGGPVTLALRHNVGVQRACFSSDGRRVVTVGLDQTTWTWDLSSADQPVEDLLLLAQLLAGERIDANAGVMALEPGALHTAWETLRPKYPEHFVVSREEILG
jgi:WD40 repeat protein